MSKEQKVIYEPHPVSPERKAELRGQGYKILDAVFKPEETPTRRTKASEQSVNSEPKQVVYVCNP